MRNFFENLQYIAEIHNDEKTTLVDLIYCKVYEVFTHKEKKLRPYEFIKIHNSEFSKIEPFLMSTQYYVLHDYLIQKGRQIFKKGRLVIADKESLRSFFEKECLKHEEATFFIIPKDVSKGHVLINTEDWNFYAMAL